VCVIAYTLQKNLHFTYLVLSYTYSVMYSSGFVTIPDKTTTNVISWHYGLILRLYWTPDLY